MVFLLPWRIQGWHLQNISITLHRMAERWLKRTVRESTQNSSNDLAREHFSRGNGRIPAQFQVSSESKGLWHGHIYMTVNVSTTNMLKVIAYIHNIWMWHCMDQQWKEHSRKINIITHLPIGLPGMRMPATLKLLEQWLDGWWLRKFTIQSRHSVTHVHQQELYVWKGDAQVQFVYCWQPLWYRHCLKHIRSCILDQSFRSAYGTRNICGISMSASLFWH